VARVASNAMAVLVSLVLGAILELYVFVQVSWAIGFLNALGLIVVLSLLGSWLVKRQGIAVWRKAQRQLGERQVPPKEIVDALLKLGAGVLLLVPGFITAALGILLLLPPIRAFVRHILVGRWTGRVNVITATYRGPIDTTATEQTNRPELPKS